MAYFETIEDAINGMLSGAALLLIDGFARAIKVSDKGYPGIGVSETDSEKVARGSNEGCEFHKNKYCTDPKKDPFATAKSQGEKSGSQKQYEYQSALHGGDRTGHCVSRD